MKREEQVLLELAEERENQPEEFEIEGDAHDILEDEFDREFWVKVHKMILK